METQHLPTGCIVVGVDAAQLTDRALDWAADQAALEERQLLLVHGIGTPFSVGTPWNFAALTRYGDASQTSATPVLPERTSASSALRCNA